MTFTPSASFIRGTATFTYALSDGAGGTDIATVLATIADAFPVAADDTATTAYATPVTTDVLVNDTDDNGDSLIVTSVVGQAHGTATITGPAPAPAPGPRCAMRPPLAEAAPTQERN